MSRVYRIFSIYQSTFPEWSEECNTFYSKSEELWFNYFFAIIHKF